MLISDRLDDERAKNFLLETIVDVFDYGASLFVIDLVAVPILIIIIKIFTVFQYLD